MATKIVEGAKGGEAEEHPPANTPDPGRNMETANKKCKIESQNVTLIRPGILDCYICSEPLEIPVFQCENGHLACSDCCSKNVKECPLCHMKIGEFRCRAIESVLESLKGSCQNAMYGCQTKFTFDERKEHLNTCLFSPCPCPLPDCEFVASSKKLYSHFNQKHPTSAINFEYWSSFTIDLKLDDKFLILREKRGGVLFVLASRSHALGKAITVNSIGWASSEDRPFFNVAVKCKGITLSFHSEVMMGVREVAEEPFPEEFLMIPNKYFGSNKNNKVKLDLRIW